MPVPEEVLQPIPGTNPSGRNLRYDPVYDKIKEARRQETDEAPQGEWAHELKRADYAVVLQLCSTALVQTTKDLQLAVWITEALFNQQGLAGLREGLELLSKLIEAFWETIYPELEEGDAEFRASPLEWLGTKFAEQLKRLPLTRDGLDWRQYTESRSVGYEADATDNEQKQQQRQQAVDEGKLTAEEFDQSLAKTRKAFYEERFALAGGCLESLSALDQLCETRFGEFRPTFSILRDQLDDLQRAIKGFLQIKRQQEPDVYGETAAAAPEIEAEPAAEVLRQVAEPIATPKVQVSAAQPANAAEATERIIALAHYLRREQPDQPVSYLVLRALRWGELRNNIGDLDSSLLEAPSTDVRKRLRALAQDADWQELMEATELAMASPCGRAWLDLQRYAVKAAEGIGYSAVGAAITSELKSVLSDCPQLSKAVLNDETPTASLETQTWLATLATSSDDGFGLHAIPSEIETAPTEMQVIDAYELAKKAACSGRPQEAIEILEREAAQEGCGRGRFERKIQLAQICMGAGYEVVALPVLEGLAAEIERRNLEEWEDPELIIHALGLLYQCLKKLDRDHAQKDKVYARICRLGPAQALELAG